MKKVSRSSTSKKRAPVTRERIFDVALSLAEKNGIEAVSMRQVAQGLGVEAMSLYKHITNKNDLVDGLIELIFSQMTLPDPKQEWKKALRERAQVMRKTLNRYPWASTLIESRGRLGPMRLRNQDNMIGILRRAGFSIELSYNILITITSYTYGFVIMENAWFAPQDDKNPKINTTPLSPNEFPYISEMKDFVSGQGNTAKSLPQPGLVKEFEFGLNNLIDGFARKLK